jgi:hypothetical protein
VWFIELRSRALSVPFYIFLFFLLFFVKGFCQDTELSGVLGFRT